MNKLKIKFHLSFIILLFLLLFSSNPLNVFSYLTCIFLHELGHYFVANILGYKLNQITFLPFGTSLSGKENVFYNKRHEILVVIAGPIVNLILIIICLALWWSFPSTYVYLNDFYFANFITFIFNLLPVYPLDGGRVLYVLLREKLPKEKAYKIIKIIGLLISIIFFIVFIISAFYKINYTLGLTSIFFVVGLFFEDNSCYYKQNFSFILKQKKLDNAIDTNIISVSLNCELYYILKKINKNKFNIVNVLDKNGNIINSITEVKLNEIFLQNSLKDKIINVLK